MVSINVDKNIPFERTLRLFSLKCRRAKIFKLIQEKAYYVSPSEKRHRRRKKKMLKVQEV